ncbi:MAG: glycine oxidase ThiO [Actinomycetota bacterium]|nr:glycine oxidase ThiO [Actinomycetota bacterium]
MSTSTVTTDVVVIGGGAIGLSAAWRIAQRGGRITIVDDVVGRGASWVAAGMLAPVTEVHYGEEPLLQLNLESSAMYGDFADELEQLTGKPVGYRRCGTLLVARDRDDNAALEELYRFQVRLGLEVERLRSSECREMEPALGANVRGGIFVKNDHQVDSRALVTALEAACVQGGVRFVRTRAKRVEVDHDRVVGVTLEDGSAIGCERVVVAAGAWSASVDGIPAGARPPLRPVKGQLLHLRSAPGRLSTAAALAGPNIRGIEVYLVVRGDGRIVIGATSEEQGFDTSVTAGAVMELLRNAYELVPGVAELELTETIAGLRPATPDNAPVIGPSALEGLIWATGHYRNGILLTPITADAVADVVASGSLPDALESFSPRRFEQISADAGVLQ